MRSKKPGGVKSEEVRIFLALLYTDMCKDIIGDWRFVYLKNSLLEGF